MKNCDLFFLGDLTELELAENITDITLCWFGELPCIKEVFPVLKGWRQLHRLTLRNHNYIMNHRNLTCPPFQVLSDFIMAMKHLSYLHIVPRFYGRSNDNQLKIQRDQVNELILPRRPNFNFDISYSDV